MFTKEVRNKFQARFVRIIMDPEHRFKGYGTFLDEYFTDCIAVFSWRVNSMKHTVKYSSIKKALQCMLLVVEPCEYCK